MSANNYSVLPFYTDINEQHHRLPYAYGNIYQLVCLQGHLLPFQITRLHTPVTGIRFMVFTKNSEYVTDINPAITINKFGTKDIIVYNDADGITALNQGAYYLQVTDGINTWYSEVFTVVSSLEGYITMTWRDLEDFSFDGGMILYDDFTNRLHICSQIGKPEYQLEEEGESRDGYFFVQKQISEKVYRFTFTAPEYLCDALRFVPLSDIVTIRDQYDRLYQVDQIIITPSWETQGDIAMVEVEFHTDTIAKKVGRAVIATSGDFNADFNNDYKIN